MAEGITLVGFHHSVYTWVVRFALAEFNMTVAYIEANPFSEKGDPTLAEYTPFNRVPVLVHNEFVLTETKAIVRYLNDLSDASLETWRSRRRARMEQIIGIADADVYPSFVRKVFAHGFYLPYLGHKSKGRVLADGLKRARQSLWVLDQIAQEGHQLTGDTFSLADIHLAPMFSYFMRVPQAAALLPRYPSLERWWQITSERETLRATDPIK